MPHRMQKVLAGVAALVAMALGGSALAGAATSQSRTTGSSGSTTQPTRPAFTGPAHGTAAHEDAEKVVTGAAAAKAQAAAVKSIGTGAAGAVTTDMQGTGYETTVTKSDGTTVEVHLDASYNAMQGGPGGPPPGAPTP